MVATLLPNGEQVFLDNNGVPLALGKVYFYIPNTSTPKNTWQDPTMGILNTNPVELDAAGRAIIYGSGSYRQVVDDALGNEIWDQLTASTDAGTLSTQTGQCFLQYNNPSTLTLIPYNGNKIVIDSILQEVPDAGVTLAPGSVTPSTLYYIYAYMNSGTITLEASTTTYEVEAGTGIYIKDSDSTRSLVGMAYPGAGPVWTYTEIARFVRSWFNEPIVTAKVTWAAGHSTTSTSFVELSSGDRLEWLAWDRDRPVIMVDGQTLNTGAAGIECGTAIAINSATVDYRKMNQASPGTSYFFNSSISAIGDPSSGETVNYATILGKVDSGTGTWAQNATGMNLFVTRRPA